MDADHPLRGSNFHADPHARMLIGAAGATGMKRIAAIQRLQVMRQLCLLTPEEDTDLARVLWTSVPQEFKQPQKWGLPPSIFLHLPDTPPGVAVEAFRAAMLVATGVLYQGSTNERFFNALRSAGRTASGSSVPRVVLTNVEMELVLLRAETWLASPSGHKGAGSARPFDDVDDAEVPIVNALLEVILPGVEPGSALADRAASLVEKMTAEGLRTEVLSHGVARLKPPALADVVENLLVAANSADGSRASLAMIGIRFWAARASDGLTVPLPEALSGQAVTSVCSLRLQPLAAALDAAATLVERRSLPRGKFSESRLLKALGTILNTVSYEAALEDGDPMVSTGEIRAACVRLACAFKGRGVSAPEVDEWISCASVDPLPEVRAVLGLTSKA